MSKITEYPIPKKSCYLPHHCVQKLSSTTTKLRVVFDASSKTSSSLSLNDVQFVGPVIQRDLFTLLLNFRSHTYALTADCEKMYRQVLLSDEDKNYHRILWRSNPDEEIQCFVLNTVTYGTASASFLATRALKQLSLIYENEYPTACNVIRNSFYMDDFLTGAETLEDLLNIKRDISSILERGGFNLRKWTSNHLSVISSTPNDIPFGKTENQATLGVIWNPSLDVLKYSIGFLGKSTSVTKRTILSIASQIFDPLGLLSPIIIVAKLIIQRLWQLKLSWDEAVPLELLTSLNKFCDQLAVINSLEIPRHVLLSCSRVVELHGFADASQKAYGACIYVRSVNSSGEVRTRLLCSKSKVAPIKSITLPRLELCACLLLANLSSKVKNNLDFEVHSCFFYSDSTIALSWIKSEPQKWKIFIANRVAEIQELTDINEWYHVRSGDNPADLVSRGVEPNTLRDSSLWWLGPPWLLLSSAEKPVSDFNFDEIDDTEVRSKSVTLVSALDNFDVFSRFSSYQKLCRVIAYCLRFTSNIKAKLSNKPLKIESLTVNEFNEAQLRVLLLAQKQGFSSELKMLNAGISLDRKSCILSLNPFVDPESGLLRVGGRLINSQFDKEKIHPTILPKHHYISKLIARDEHIKLMHCGTQQLLSSPRERYWPLGGSNYY